MASRDFTLRKVAIRMVDEPPLFSDVPMNSPNAAIKAMADTFSQYDREVVEVVNLRSDLKPINMNIVSMGALDACFVHPRELLKSVVLSNASAIMMVHNHPSGNMNPSKEDVAITDKMSQICKLMDVKLLDHVIVGPGKEYFSFFEKKILPLADLKFETDIANIELEGLKVAENTAFKTEERKKTEATLTVAECSEFHNLGEMVQDIPTVKQALETFGRIDPSRMNGIPAIGIRVAPKDEPFDFVETDIYNGKVIDLEMLSYIPEIANDWNAQRLIADLVHQCPDAEIRGEITPGIQKQLQFIESREKQAEALKGVTDQLEQGVKDVFSSDKYKQFLDTMAKFPRYSVNNTILIMMQKPEAQLCQSYTGWKEMGRYVKKGEKGISILAPAPYKIEKEQTKVDDKGNFVFDKDGEPVTEKVEVTIRAFKVVKTFDISQTDGKEVPSLGVNELVGSIEGYPKMLQALQEISPVPITFEQIDGGSKGYFHQADKKIAIQDGMSEVQTIKTLVHEMAHQKLHDKDLVVEAADISRNGTEVEAESVAYVVCQHYGINTSDYSFSYVAGWSEGKETPELKSSLDKIRQTAAEFITKLDEKLEVLMQSKEQTQEIDAKGQEKTLSIVGAKNNDIKIQNSSQIQTERTGGKLSENKTETKENTPNPDLKSTVDKVLGDLGKKRSTSKSSVKSKIKEEKEKSDKTPKKPRATTKSKKEERA